MRLSRIVLFLAAIFLLHKYTLDKEAATTFGNSTYFFKDAPFAQKAALVNGKHEEPYLRVFYEKKYVYGDFNRDGLRDAAVIITENTGGNASWHTLAFLINDGKTLVHRASRTLDDRAVINSMKEKNGKVVIDMYVHQEGDCMGGPTKRVRNIYEYTGPEFDKLKVLPRTIFCLSPNGMPG